MLKKIVNYHPESGVFTWRVSRGRRKAGDIAGSAEPGRYVSIGIARRAYLAHRLAWLYIHGELPEHEIDHINRDGHDNRIDNLRPSTRAENAYNRGADSRNASGYKGVIYWRGRWQTNIRVDGKSMYVGRFSTALEAAEAYNQAARKYFGEFAYQNPTEEIVK